MSTGCFLTHIDAAALRMKNCFIIRDGGYYPPEKNNLSQSTKVTPSGGGLVLHDGLSLGYSLLSTVNVEKHNKSS